jgi:hypothetical protein
MALDMTALAKFTSKRCHRAKFGAQAPSSIEGSAVLLALSRVPILRDCADFAHLTCDRSLVVSALECQYCSADCLLPCRKDLFAMSRILSCALLLIFALTPRAHAFAGPGHGGGHSHRSSSASKTVHVRRYTRKDGTVVAEHERAAARTAATIRTCPILCGQAGDLARFGFSSQSSVCDLLPPQLSRPGLQAA